MEASLKINRYGIELGEKSVMEAANFVIRESKKQCPEIAAQLEDAQKTHSDQRTKHSLESLFDQYERTLFTVSQSVR